MTLALASCKKDVVIPETETETPDPTTPETTYDPPQLTEFHVQSEITKATVDVGKKTIKVAIGELLDWSNLTITYKTTNSGVLMEDDQRIDADKGQLDFSAPPKLVLQSPNGQNRSTWSFEINSTIESYGLGDILKQAKSLDKDYDYYIDQVGTGAYENDNCGPTVTTMALKWADPSFNKSVTDARAAIRPTGGWWYTQDIERYLKDHGINMAYSNLSKSLSASEYADKIVSIIDKGYQVILCLDMSQVAFNGTDELRTNKFYPEVVTGHFLLVKGYKTVDNKTWLEVHDPYSNRRKYASGQLKGKNRYYEASELKKATDNWWARLITVAPKGTSIQGVSTLSSTEIQGIAHQKGGTNAL